MRPTSKEHCVRCGADLAPAGHCTRREAGCQGGWGEPTSPAWHINDGGTLKPVKKPTAAETPAAKHDVEALLREADEYMASPIGRGAIHVLCDLAAALRAERERADEMTEKSCTDWKSRCVARSHLRAVLDFMWPGDTGGPTVVQKARAFLAGEEQAPRYDDMSGPNQARYAIRCERKRANDAEEENVRLRAQLSAEDEAHAHTRARLAEALKGQTRASDELAKALAAQNRAESKAASLRIEVTDLQRKLAEGDVMVDQLVAWAKKGRA